MEEVGCVSNDEDRAVGRLISVGETKSDPGEVCSNRYDCVSTCCTMPVELSIVFVLIRRDLYAFVFIIARTLSANRSLGNYWCVIHPPVKLSL